MGSNDRKGRRKGCGWEVMAGRGGGKAVGGKYPTHTLLLFKENQILPLDEMIKFAKLKFMHCYANQKLPLSFHGNWPLNRDVNPARILRNANDLRVPPHHFATIKRLPIFNFPQAWNEEEERKFIPSLKLYCKTLKTALLNSLAA